MIDSELASTKSIIQFPSSNTLDLSFRTPFFIYLYKFGF